MSQYYASGFISESHHLVVNSDNTNPLSLLSQPYPYVSLHPHPYLTWL